MIDSSSTLEAVQAAYDDAASYAEDNSITKARAFVTACRILLRRMPRSSGDQVSHLALSPELIQAEIERGMQWIAANDTGVSGSAGPGTTRSDFQNFRS
jgi:hypothetical protein